MIMITSANIQLGLGLDGKGDGTAQNGDQDDGRLGSRQSGSRPASTLGSQPASSLRSRKDRLRRNLGVEVRFSILPLSLS